MTAEDRRKDIEFLARWARDYSPLVELNERYKGTPSYEALLPRYLELAEQARSDEEFYLAVWGYFRVIGASGHAYLVPDDYLKWGRVGAFFRMVDLGITPGQLQRARYWPRLAGRLSTRAHPPFAVVGREGRYFTGDVWQSDGIAIPKGSEIVEVDGMACSRYLESIKERTSLKYDAYSKDWVDDFLMIVDEGPSFKGWRVKFAVSEGTGLTTFVPKVEGFPGPTQEDAGCDESKENCTCIELTDRIGYIRIRSFMGSPLDFVFKRYIERDRKKIRAFLERSHGRYDRLIVDVRGNSGGDPAYFYDNLVRPFLDRAVTYEHIVGLKRRFLEDTKLSVLRQLRKTMAPKYVTGMEEVTAPEGLDARSWVFYEITRRLEPSKRYRFTGDVYILIDGGCFSACDDYASTVKRIGLATLAGQTTGGAGGIGYCMTPFVRLPRSGMVLALDVHLPLNPDGSFTAFHGLEPDVKLPDADPLKSTTKEDLLKDEWIKGVIAQP
ncbi:MAG: S41 family peptidase [Phycisphaerales bacterium]